MKTYQRGWEMSSKKYHKDSISMAQHVRSFSGAKFRSMKDNVKPCIRDKNPDHTIMHVRTNDLNSENNSEKVAKPIVDLAKRMVSQKRNVTVSGIKPRNDK